MKRLLLFLLLVAGTIFASAQGIGLPTLRYATYVGQSGLVGFTDDYSALECIVQDRYVVALLNGKSSSASFLYDTCITITDMYDVMNYPDTIASPNSPKVDIIDLSFPPLQGLTINDLYAIDDKVFFLRKWLMAKGVSTAWLPRGITIPMLSWWN